MIRVCEKFEIANGTPPNLRRTGASMMASERCGVRKEEENPTFVRLGAAELRELNISVGIRQDDKNNRPNSTHTPALTTSLSQATHDLANCQSGIKSQEFRNPETGTPSIWPCTNEPRQGLS